MKTTTATATLASWLLAATTNLLCAQPALNPPPASPVTARRAAHIGPRIQFQTPVYDFGKVRSGEPVKYTFIFTNTGDAVLVLTGVQTSCGCTTVGEWSRQVEPGRTGAISIQYNSPGYSGQVLKIVTVASNDKSQPAVGLQLKGAVWQPVEVQPGIVVLTIPPEAQSNVTATAHILNHMDQPLEVWGPESIHRGFAVELRTNTPGRDFLVAISAAPPFEAAGLRTQITLKTSSTNVPVVRLTALANFAPTRKPAESPAAPSRPGVPLSLVPLREPPASAARPSAN